MAARNRIIRIKYPKLYWAGDRVSLNSLTEVGADRIGFINANNHRLAGGLGRVGPFDVSNEVYEKCCLYQIFTVDHFLRV